MIVPTVSFWRETLRQIGYPTNAGPLAAAHIKLVKAPFTPNANLALADVTVADFDGYADQTTPSSAGNWNKFTSQDGNPMLSYGGAQLNQWKFTAPVVTPNVIYGYVLYDNATSLVMAAERFATTVPMQVQTDLLRMVLALEVIEKWNIGGAIIIN